MRKQLSLWVWLLAVGGSLAVLAQIAEAEEPRPNPTPVDHNMPSMPKIGRFAEHVDQKRLYDQIRSGFHDQTTESASRLGDDFFDSAFLATWGIGANVGAGKRFTRVPRADLNGPNEWANHFPARATGPNAQSCIECHTSPAHDGSGFIAWNAVRDPLHSGNPKLMIERQTTHLFGAGGVQLLAEEMTADLQAILKSAKNEACGPTAATCLGAQADAAERGCGVTRKLISKGVGFGTITVKRVVDEDGPFCKVTTTGIEGIDSDLVVRPFQWKGTVATIRDFNRGASHNEIGMQATELAGLDVDGDGDGVANEVTVGDMTALTVYVGLQPRPMTKIELADMNKILPVGQEERMAIKRGERVFKQVGCAVCHVPELKLKDPVFREPSKSAYFRDKIFPSGDDPVEAFLDPKYPISANLTVKVAEPFGQFMKDDQGLTRVELFSDLKRHDLGTEDAEPIDEAGTGASVWLTRPLWGLGSTWPYLHDGRATTVGEAIQFHGGEAAGARALYNVRPQREKDDLDAYLLNLRLWKEPDKDS